MKYELNFLSTESTEIVKEHLIDLGQQINDFVKEQESKVYPKFYVVVSKDRKHSITLFDIYKTIFVLEILTFDDPSKIYLIFYNRIETLFAEFIDSKDLSTFLNSNLILK